MHRLLPLALACSSLLAACHGQSSQVTRARQPVTSELTSSPSPAPQQPALLESAPSPGPLQAHSAENAQAKAATPAKGGAPESKNSREVPAFSVIDQAGNGLSSDELVGRQAFVVVFFATWCELCSRKMPVVRRALEKVPGVKVLLVTVDSSETWAHVPGFLREQRLGGEQVISGLEYPAFTQGYNPVSSIPLVAIVSQSGELVDYQIGLLDGDGPRLESALRTAVGTF